MFKKHKYKFLTILILFVVLGSGSAYYFKKKADKKKVEEIETKEAPEEQPKEPLVPGNSEEVESVTEDESTLSKGSKINGSNKN